MAIETPESKLNELHEKVTRLEKNHSAQGITIQKTKQVGEVILTMRIENITGGIGEVDFCLTVINKELKLKNEL